MACCNDNPVQGCIDCTSAMTYLDTFCQQGCVDYPATDCVLFSGDTINGPVTITNGENLTDIIKALVGATATNGVDITWTNSTRSLCLKNNGTTIRCVTIADQDDQYLTLTSNRYLKIFKPMNTGNSADDVQIGSTLDLSVLFTETTFSASSNSLVVTAGGTHGHSPEIELVPSTDASNALVLGTDGKPFVHTVSVPITSIVFPSTPGITRTVVNVSGTVTVTETLDFTYIASQVCPLCTPTCQAPTNLVVTS